MKKTLVVLLALVFIGMFSRLNAATLPPALAEILKKDPIMLLWTGTGFFITDDGYALTNCHVACHAGVNYTTIFNGSIHKVKLIRQLGNIDVALIKVELKEGEKVIPLPISVRKPVLGESAIIVGYPLSESSIDPVSASFGTVTKTIFEGKFIVDAAAFPGNSGSPIIDKNGGVIGILYGVKVGENFLMLGSNVAIPATMFATGLTDIPYTLSRGYLFGVVDAYGPSLGDLGESVFMIQSWGHISLILGH